MKLLSRALSPYANRSVGFCVVVLTAMVMLGCEQSDSNTAPMEYIGVWELDAPMSASISYSALDAQGQEIEITANGEMMVTLELAQNGDLLSALRFEINDYPSCGTDAPCSISMSRVDQYTHQYLDTGASPEGVSALLMRFARVDQSQSSDGFLYVDANHMCISNILWDVVTFNQPQPRGVDPLAINFENCFSRL